MSTTSDAEALLAAIREVQANRNNPDRVWDQVFGKGWRKRPAPYSRVLTEEEAARDAIAGEMFLMGIDGPG